MKPYIEGLQDGSVCHRIMYQKEEKMLSRLMTLKKKVPRVGFEITYLSYFSIFSTSSPEKKYAVVKFILQHKSSDNTLIITNRELAKKCSVGINTVTDTLKLLRNAGLIQTRTGAIMLNQNLQVAEVTRRKIFAAEIRRVSGMSRSETFNMLL